MKIYIVKWDVPYESGDVLDVCSSREEAEKALEQFKQDRIEDNFRVDEDYLSIEEWIVKCPSCGE